MATIRLDFDAPDLPEGIVLTALRRTDTDASVTLPVDTDFTDEGSGVWSIEFDEPTAGLTYEYEATATWDDATTSPFNGTIDGEGGTGFEGRYTTEAECLQYIGSLNLTVYNDVDSDGAKDSGSVQQAIVSAESDVDFCTNGPYSFSDDANGLRAGEKFEWWSRVLAVVQMLSKRLPSDDPTRMAVYQERKLAYAQMESFKSGKANLPGAIPDNVPADDETPEPGTFTNVTMAFDPTCTADEYSS